MQVQDRETDYLGISTLAGVAVKGCNETETGCIAGGASSAKTTEILWGAKNQGKSMDRSEYK